MIDRAFQEWRDALATGENLDATAEHLFRLMRRYAGWMVWSMLHRHDPQLVTDIVELAFLRAQTFEGTSTFGTWFFSLARNQVLKDIRDRRMHRETFLEDMLEEPVAPSHLPSDDRQTVDYLLEQLRGTEDFKLVQLKLWGYTEEEIAKKLGWTPNQVKWKWRRCRKRSREILGDRDASGK